MRRVVFIGLLVTALTLSAFADCNFECRGFSSGSKECYEFIACPNPPPGHGGSCGNMATCDIHIECFLWPDCMYSIEYCVGDQCYVA